MWFLITIAFVGLVSGLIARALVSGPHPTGCLPTMALGIVGSLIGGFIGYVVFDKDVGSGAFQTSGLLGSIFGAVVALLVYRKFADA